MGYQQQHLGLLTLEAKSAPTWNSNCTCTLGALVHGHRAAQSLQHRPCSPLLLAVSLKRCHLRYRLLCAVTSSMTNSLLNILMPFLSVVQVHNSKKEFQPRTLNLPYKHGYSQRGGHWCHVTHLSQFSTANDTRPFDRATCNSLDNKALILCCWTTQKCSLKSREVFIEHQNLQHLLNGTNQKVGFQIKEQLNKWWLDVCTLGY